MTKAPEPPTDAKGRRWHDMGGAIDRSLGGSAIVADDHDYALWEKRVDALMVLASSKGHFTVDGLRRALEDMGPQAFESMSYYERWIAAITQNFVEAGVFTLEELRAKIAEVETRGATYGEASDRERRAKGRRRERTRPELRAALCRPVCSRRRASRWASACG